MNDLLNNLSSEQCVAVVLPPINAIVLGAAGSGKTHILITRIAWLISTGQVGAHNILAVTFTNKAAKEMIVRLAASLPVINTQSMWIGTFHGLCNRLLRAHYREAGLPPDFQILDRDAQLEMVDQLLLEMNIDREKYQASELCYFINAHKDQGIRAAQAEGYDSYSRKCIDFYSQYENRCNRDGLVDLAETVLRCYELLLRNQALRQHYQERFRNIFIDDLECATKLQRDWIKLLGSCSENNAPPPNGAKIFAFLDDGQSIYSYLWADPVCLKDLEDDFSFNRVVKLEQNYRSTTNIVNAANSLLAKNQKSVSIVPKSGGEPGSKLSVFEAPSATAEAGYVTNEICKLVDNGQSLSQIAILYRSNAQSRLFEHELIAHSIPYKIHGALSFFQRREVKDVLAYLRLLSNPNDDSAFLRVVNRPTRGIDTRLLENLQVIANQSNLSLYSAAPSLTGRAGQMVGDFIRLIDRLRQETANLPLPELVAHVIEKSGLVQYYRLDKTRYDRLENLDELINAAATFVDDKGVVTSVEAACTALLLFLTHASLESGEHQTGQGQGVLQLMSIHAAKGLEFDNVFITGLEQGLFPNYNAFDDLCGFDEERRVLYVALTRARKKIYLSYAKTRILKGKMLYRTRSSFLDEIPESLLAYRDVSRVTMESNNDQFQVGETIEHDKFGTGVILTAEGKGPEARIQVSFGSAFGVKWLMLHYAQRHLTKL